jgi:hypothetical protein
MQLFMDNVPTLAIQAPIIRKLPEMFCPTTVFNMKPELVTKIAGEAEEKIFERTEILRKLKTLEDGARICKQYSMRPQSRKLFPSVVIDKLTNPVLTPSIVEVGSSANIRNPSKPQGSVASQLSSTLQSAPQAPGTAGSAAPPPFIWGPKNESIFSQPFVAAPTSNSSSLFSDLGNAVTPPASKGSLLFSDFGNAVAPPVYKGSSLFSGFSNAGAHRPRQSPRSSRSPEPLGTSDRSSASSDGANDVASPFAALKQTPADVPKTGAKENPPPPFGGARAGFAGSFGQPRGAFGQSGSGAGPFGQSGTGTHGS